MTYSELRRIDETRDVPPLYRPYRDLRNIGVTRMLHFYVGLIVSLGGIDETRDVTPLYRPYTCYIATDIKWNGMCSTHYYQYMLQLHADIQNHLSGT